MFEEVVDDCIPVLKLFPDWFVTSKTIKILVNVLYAGGNILYFNHILVQGGGGCLWGLYPNTFFGITSFVVNIFTRNFHSKAKILYLIL